jgi:hypothetical protein
MGSLVAIEKLREHIRTLYKNDKRFAHIFLGTQMKFGSYLRALHENLEHEWNINGVVF